MRKHSLFLLIVLFIFSCKKNNDTTTETSCTGSTKMYLVKKDGGSSLGKDSFAYDSQNRMTYAKFNSSGRIATLANATFTYDASSRIIKSVVRDNSNNSIIGTYVFTYRSDNKLDSIYIVGSGDNNFKFTYNSSGKLTRITEYDMPSNTSDFYVNITTDNNNNITSALTYFFGSADDNLTFTYDNKNNPLAGLAFFFVGLDDIEDLVTNFGKNNYTNQTAKINTGSGTITVISGEKYDYNSNCYPVKDYVTINGVPPLGTDPFFTYTYK